MKLISTMLLLGVGMGSGGVLHAEEPATSPRPVPLTRPVMKQYLEDLKARQPRIPLPPLTEEEKEKLGTRGTSYEARIRALYLPPGEGRGGGGTGREADARMSLDYTFKTELFWIVSRTNNCQYCLGHQEVKLAAAGLKEEQLAALDCAWSEFTPAQQAAFALARKLTYEPHRLTDADLDKVRAHYTPLQILEMALSVAGNNSMNRWTEGLGIPQSKDLSGFGRRGQQPDTPTQADLGRTFLTPTPEKYRDQVTRVAPLGEDTSAGLTRKTVCMRPALEARAEVERALAACRKRTPRLPLVDEDTARALLPDDWAKGPLPQWVRLLANFPTAGKSRILSFRAADEKGDLKPLLKAQLSWIIARQDRAWYAVAEARQRLRQQGWSEDQIFRLDGDWADFAPADRALFTVARKLAASPIVLTDDDVARALQLTGPREVVQVITYTTHRASFDRITEVAGLQWQD
jgi:AhpD family alkylhydroperoxidase